ncbi:uncharacterized protein [Musca autumnalis]|uniref:uncharacterized protein n=1 Tax=Musca autumnalis TaxID=221902 RepID=UPI003CF92689
MPSKRLCVVPGCENGKKFHYSTTSLHMLRGKLKTLLINRYKLIDHNRMFICANHFAPHLYLRRGKKLMEDAIPTLNMPPPITDKPKNVEFLEEVVILEETDEYIDIEDAIEEVDYIDSNSSTVEFDIENDVEDGEHIQEEEQNGQNDVAEKEVNTTTAATNENDEYQSVVIFPSNHIEIGSTVQIEEIVEKPIHQIVVNVRSDSPQTMEDTIPAKKFKPNTVNETIVVFPKNAADIEDVIVEEVEDSIRDSECSNNLDDRPKEICDTKTVKTINNKSPLNHENAEGDEVVLYPDHMYIEDAVVEVDDVVEELQQCDSPAAAANVNDMQKSKELKRLEEENRGMRNILSQIIYANKFKCLEEENRSMRNLISQLESRVKSLETKLNLLQENCTTHGKGKEGEATTLQKCKACGDPSMHGKAQIKLEEGS